MQPKTLIIQTFYPEFLTELYAQHPGLSEQEYSAQLRCIFETAYGLSDAYSHGLRAAGCEAHEVICNADLLQAQWAKEHNVTLAGNLHDQRRQAVAAQIDHYRPDVVLVFEWCPLGDALLAEISPRVRLLAGQISSPLPANRTFAAYDLMLSSWPPIVDYFRNTGQNAQPLKLAFDERILNRRQENTHPDCPTTPVHCSPSAPSRLGGSVPSSFPLTFVGGFAANHADRIAWLEHLLQHVDIRIFGYGLEHTAPDSPIRRHHHGPVWGMQMYDVLQRSRITLNYHARIDVRGRVDTHVAANMRLYEATGIGTCLLTEAKDNLREMFEPDREVLTFRDEQECIEKIRHYLSHESERAVVAAAGRNRTLRDHTYAVRMRELCDIFCRCLNEPTAKRRRWPA